MKLFRISAIALAMALLCVACARPAPSPSPTVTTPPARLSAQSSPTPGSDGGELAMPDKFTKGEEPQLKVYVADEGAVRDMSIEQYLQGVLAGEMKNDWPMEALKAQAIIARTYTMKFIKEKGGSKYDGADVSTDITEAQAYDAEGINDRIKQAIEETRGEVIGHNGDFIYAWFHAHSGGITAMAKEGLGYEKDEPPYIKSVESADSEQAPQEAASWSETFPKSEILRACADLGLGLEGINTVELGAKGPSGRVQTLIVNGGEEVPAPAFRIALDSLKMRSTLLTGIEVQGDSVVISGRGYGHGVGMPQWGAYAMAEEGKKAEDIVTHYFKDVSISKMW